MGREAWGVELGACVMWRGAWGVPDEPTVRVRGRGTVWVRVTMRARVRVEGEGGR